MRVISQVTALEGDDTETAASGYDIDSSRWGEMSQLTADVGDITG